MQDSDIDRGFPDDNNPTIMVREVIRAVIPARTEGIEDRDQIGFFEMGF